MQRRALKATERQQDDGKSVAYNIYMTYLYTLIWIALSSIVIIINKFILSFTSMHYPVFLTLSHMGFAGALAGVLIRSRVIEPIEMDMETYYQTCVPIAGLFAGTLWLGNSAYLYLSVAFIQMLKAMMPACVFTVGCLFGVESYAHSYVLILVLVTLGVVISSYGELNFNVMGIVLQCSSLITESFRLVLIQLLLQRRGIKMNPIHSLYYIAPPCFGFLCIPFVLRELPLMLHDDLLVINPFLMIASAAAAFALNVAVFLLIGKSSALTMNIAGVVKDWLLIAFSVAIFKSPVTVVQCLGYSVALLGVSSYNHVKLRSMKQEARGVKTEHEENDPLVGNIQSMQESQK